MRRDNIWFQLHAVASANLWHSPKAWSTQVLPQPSIKWPSVPECRAAALMWLSVTQDAEVPCFSSVMVRRSVYALSALTCKTKDKLNMILNKTVYSDFYLLKNLRHYSQYSRNRKYPVNHSNNIDSRTILPWLATRSLINCRIGFGLVFYSLSLTGSTVHLSFALQLRLCSWRQHRLSNMS